jgi:hypothetical protein
MSNLKNRVSKLEGRIGQQKTIVALRESYLYSGVKINGVSMSDDEFTLFKQSLPEKTKLIIVGD